MTKLHHYAIAIAIIIASVIYVFGNRYAPFIPDEIIALGTLDRFTGKVYTMSKQVYDLTAVEQTSLKPETP